MNKPTRIIMKLEQKDFAQYLNDEHLIPVCDVYITNTVCGRAHITDNESKYITIPKHAMNREWGYFVYYIAHELAHIQAWNIFKVRGHCKEFFDCFIQICPKEYQKWEYDYKPSFGRHSPR